ncbi:MAG: hypothetical protein QXT64_07245 [Desulfurococcaceae archaeon]
MLKVRVKDVIVITVKPRMTQTTYQYVFVVEDQYGFSKVYFIDTDKYDKQKFIELVKLDYAGKYAIPVSNIEVEFFVEPPRVS